MRSNGEFIGGTHFPSLKPTRLKAFLDEKLGPYEMADEGVNEKPSFAMEILLASKSEKVKVRDKVFEVEYVNWKTPAYIKEGLQWLKKD